ncbi:MAG: hypothetical protein KGJ07_10500 [Patescibacteria group bacterium]|nr:hypothetical protein [Patescibacteria group bacterium]
MTKQQQKWAAQHDWYLGADGNSVLVDEVLVCRDGTVVQSEKSFTDFQALRDWAGY